MAGHWLIPALACPSWSQVAAQLLLACDACQRAPAAIQLYRLLANGAPAGSCSTEAHAAGARAYLREASSGGSSSGESLQAALAVLEAHAEPLLGLADAALAQAATAAATRGLDSTASSATATEQRWGQPGAAGEDASAEQRHAALQPPVRAALWGLRLQAACGGKDSELSAAARQVVSSVGGSAGGAQLLLLLQVLKAELASALEAEVLADAAELLLQSRTPLPPDVSPPLCIEQACALCDCAVMR